VGQLVADHIETISERLEDPPAVAIDHLLGLAHPCRILGVGLVVAKVNGRDDRAAAAVDAIALEGFEIIIVHNSGAVVRGLRDRVARALALVDQLPAWYVGGVVGREGDAPLIAFSPRKNSLTLYLPGFESKEQLLQKLGKHKQSGGCTHIVKLTDVDNTVLRQLLNESFKHAETTHCK